MGRAIILLGTVLVLLLAAQAPAGSDEATPAASELRGLEGRYYDRGDFTKRELVRIDGRVRFDWGRRAPSRGMGRDHFSVRWRGAVTPPRTGTYTFYTRTNGGARLWVDGKRIVNRGTARGTREWSGRVRLRGGQRHTIRLDYVKRTGLSQASLAWRGPRLGKQIVPSSRLAPPRPPSRPAPSPPVTEGPAPAPPAPDPAPHSPQPAPAALPTPSLAVAPAPAPPPPAPTPPTPSAPAPAPPAPASTPPAPAPQPPAPEPEPPLPGAQRWSDPATWGAAGVPDAGDTVTVPQGETVLLDSSPPPLAGLRVDGTLVFADEDLTLSSDWIMVHGTLRVGTAEQPFTERATIRLTGANPAQDIMGMGAKVLGVMGGTLEVHGQPRDGWTRLAANAPAGATQLTLESSVDWRAGDRIAIASTDYQPSQDEEATITSVSGATVRLDRALERGHFGERQTYGGQTVDERAEVALLSRNVTIEGEQQSSAGGFGGQIMVMGDGRARISGAELTRMGQRNTLRRYPVHFHMLGDAGENSYVKDSSLHNMFNRCITIHGTNRLRIAGNTCYDHVGHGFFMEDGAEVDNVLEGNLGFRTRAPAGGEGLLPSDEFPATYWITNPDNELRGNVAGGSDGMGFWYALPKAPTGLSATTSVWPRRTPLGVFADNVAHSNMRNGLHVDSGPRPDGSTEPARYTPRADPRPPAAGEADSAPVEARFERFVGWRNRERGVWLRGHDQRLAGAVLADNAIGVTLANVDSVVADSLIVGETANRGTPAPWEVSRGEVGVDGRSLPQPWVRDHPIRGFEFYDGPVSVEDTTFAGFHTNALRPSGGLGFLLKNRFTQHPGNFATGLRFPDASNRVHQPDPVAGYDGDASSLFTDRDGTTTGVPGGVVSGRNPFLVKPECLAQPGALRVAWNAYVCAPTDHARLVLRPSDGNAAAIVPVRVTRASDGATQTVWGADGEDRAVTALLPDREYDLTYNGGSPQRMSYTLWNGSGRWTVLSMPYPVRPRVTKYGCDLATTDWCRGAATGLDDLRAKDRSAYWYDDAAGRLYLKLVAVDAWSPGRPVIWEELDVEPAP